jgi:hypothetical protein
MPCSKGRQKTGHQSRLGPSDCAICRYANIDPVTDCQTCPMRLRPAQVYRERGTGSCPCLHLHEVPTELRKRDELLGLVPKGKRANHRELHNILSQGLGSTRSISRLLPHCGTGRFFISGASFPDTIAFAAGMFAGHDLPPPRAVLYWDNRPRWLGEPEEIDLLPQGDD